MAGEANYNDVAHSIPSFARSVLCCWCAPSELSGDVARRVETFEPNSMESGAQYDAIVAVPPGGLDDLTPLLERLTMVGHEDTLYLLVLPPETSPEDLGELLETTGLAVYYSQSLRRSGPDERWDMLLAVVPQGYHPQAHAHRLFEARRYADSLTVLRSVPQTLMSDPTTQAAVCADMLVCELALARNDPEEEQPGHFFNGQACFYKVCEIMPAFPTAYRNYARLWRSIGSDTMAARVLRSLLHVIDDGPARSELAQCRPQIDVMHDRPAPPQWSAEEGPSRILIINQQRPDYGLDVLHYGLAQLLGGENITDFPWKGSLHGVVAEDQKHYPCMFDLPGEKRSLRDVVEALQAGDFDVLAFGDTEGHLDPAVARLLAKAARDIPLVLVDQGDECVDQRRAVTHYLDREPDVVFKREMLACYNYGPGVYPLPFAYRDDLVPETVSSDRSRDLFWAGHRRFSLRRLYLEHIERVFGLDLAISFPQEQYAEQLRSSRIGLSIFGFGYDTVRYWELPAQGCMLLSERLPITVPHNFVDGESAVFFDDLPDLEQKLRYYLEHPEECARIAAAGHSHLRRFHTATSRARQFLGCLQAEACFNGTG